MAVSEACALRREHLAPFPLAQLPNEPVLPRVRAAVQLHIRPFYGERAAHCQRVPIARNCTNVRASRPRRAARRRGVRMQSEQQLRGDQALNIAAIVHAAVAGQLGMSVPYRSSSGPSSGSPPSLPKTRITGKQTRTRGIRSRPTKYWEAMSNSVMPRNRIVEHAELPAAIRTPRRSPAGQRPLPPRGRTGGPAGPPRSNAGFAASAPVRARVRAGEDPHFKPGRKTRPGHPAAASRHGDAAVSFLGRQTGQATCPL